MDPERSERIKARMQAAIELREARMESPRRKAKAQAAQIEQQQQRQKQWDQCKQDVKQRQLVASINGQLQGNAP